MAEKTNPAFFKPSWEMTSRDKVDFIERYGSEVWANKLKSEIPDYKDKEALQEYQQKIEEARRRDDPHGFRR